MLRLEIFCCLAKINFHLHSLTAYPPVGMMIVSFRGGSFKFKPGTFPFSHVGSFHLALEKKN